MFDESAAPTGKIKVWKTLWWSYRLPVKEIRHLARFGWKFVIAVAAIYLAILFQPMDHSEFTSIILTLIVVLILLLAMAQFAVTWHRFILVPSRANRFAHYWRQVRAYFVLVVIFPILIWLFTAPGIVFQQLGLSSTLTLIGSLIYLILALTVLYPLALILLMFGPAIAIGDVRQGYRWVWRSSKGNRKRLAATLLISSLIQAVVLELGQSLLAKVTVLVFKALEVFDFASFFAQGSSDPMYLGLGGIIIAPLFGVWMLLVIVPTLTALSLSYAQFRPPTTGDTPASQPLPASP